MLLAVTVGIKGRSRAVPIWNSRSKGHLRISTSNRREVLPFTSPLRSAFPGDSHPYYTRKVSIARHLRALLRLPLCPRARIVVSGTAEQRVIRIPAGACMVHPNSGISSHRLHSLRSITTDRLQFRLSRRLPSYLLPLA